MRVWGRCYRPACSSSSQTFFWSIFLYWKSWKAKKNVFLDSAVSILEVLQVPEVRLTCMKLDFRTRHSLWFVDGSRGDMQQQTLGSAGSFLIIAWVAQCCMLQRQTQIWLVAFCFLASPLVWLWNYSWKLSLESVSCQTLPTPPPHFSDSGNYDTVTNLLLCELVRTDSVLCS